MNPSQTPDLIAVPEATYISLTDAQMDEFFPKDSKRVFFDAEGEVGASNIRVSNPEMTLKMLG